MSYMHILSDLEMEKLYDTLNVDIELPRPERRPDIAIISNDNISESSNKVEVVIVELKKLNLDVCRNKDVVEQMKQRARNLMVLYPNRISRIWFYGIVDFDDELNDTIYEDGWIPVYSKDQMQYKRQKIRASNGNDCEVDFFLLSHQSLCTDAELRNETFLKILRSGFKELVTCPT